MIILYILLGLFFGAIALAFLFTLLGAGMAGMDDIGPDAIGFWARWRALIKQIVSGK